MMVLALAAIVFGCWLLSVSLNKIAAEAEASMQRRREAENPYSGAPEDGDWEWPPPDLTITHRKAHNDTEHRPG